MSIFEDCRETFADRVPAQARPAIRLCTDFYFFDISRKRVGDFPPKGPRFFLEACICWLYKKGEEQATLCRKVGNVETPRKCVLS